MRPANVFLIMELSNSRVRAACAQTWTELLQGYRLAPVQFLDICGK